MGCTIVVTETEGSVEKFNQTTAFTDESFAADTTINDIVANHPTIADAVFALLGSGFLSSNKEREIDVTVGEHNVKFTVMKDGVLQDLKSLFK